jgi:hypothetical protein
VERCERRTTEKENKSISIEIVNVCVCAEHNSSKRGEERLYERKRREKGTSF